MMNEVCSCSWLTSWNRPTATSFSSGNNIMLPFFLPTHQLCRQNLNGQNQRLLRQSSISFTACTKSSVLSDVRLLLEYAFSLQMLLGRFHRLAEALVTYRYWQVIQAYRQRKGTSRTIRMHRGWLWIWCKRYVTKLR
jgi:hypothetical protein